MSTINPAAAAARENARAANGQFGNQQHSVPSTDAAPFALENCSREEEARLMEQHARSAALANEHARALLAPDLPKTERAAIIESMRQYRRECELIEQQLAWYRRRDPRSVVVPCEPAWEG